MKDDIGTARKLFGEMAVQKGYCTKKDVERALEVQRALEESGGPRKMLGLIMLEETMIDNQQFIELLMELDHLVHDHEAMDYDVEVDTEEEEELDALDEEDINDLL